MFKIVDLSTLQEFARSHSEEVLKSMLKYRTYYITDGGNIRYFDQIKHDSGWIINIPSDYIKSHLYPKHLLEVIEVK